MYTKEKIKEMRKKLLNEYKYCPACKSRTTILTDTKEEVFTISCSSLFCEGLYLLVNFNNEILEHYFSLPEDDNLYCGKCGDIVITFGECSCKKYK